MHFTPGSPETTLQADLLAQASRALAARAESESRRKDLFIATVAHELRNMMAPLDSALEILERSPANPELIGRALPIARRQVRHLGHLVDDLQDIGRIVNDQVVLERRVLDLRQLVQETASACEPMFSARGVELTLRLQPDPARIRGDSLRLAQVLTNLLQNAAKFTPRGGHVVVSLATDDELAVAELRVADDGCGIARGELENIFGVFKRESRSRGVPGLGIGLAVVRRLVQLHGGTVHAESAGQNRGATFVVRLPAQVARTGTARPLRLARV